MASKKRILLLTTGGTIASAPNGDGLAPRHSGIMAHDLERLREYYEITVEDIMCLDSSNIRPEEWQTMARVIFDRYPKYDGIVVSHGTDTMAYTASALTFMLPNIPIPVAACGHGGIFLAFDRKVMRGCRAVKVRASGFSAFESINARYAGRVTGRGLELDFRMLPACKGTPMLRDAVSQDVFLLKLTPGLSPDIFHALAQMGYRGIVLEAFGLGGVNVLGQGLSGIRKAVELGISVVITTQCLYDSADLKVYQVGNQLLELGVIQGRDMTSEAAMTKLMWALGQGMNQKEISDLFAQSLAGEITLEE